jgi:hypothetical protein
MTLNERLNNTDACLRETTDALYKIISCLNALHSDLLILHKTLEQPEPPKHPEKPELTDIPKAAIKKLPVFLQMVIAESKIPYDMQELTDLVLHDHELSEVRRALRSLDLCGYAGNNLAEIVTKLGQMTDRRLRLQKGIGSKTVKLLREFHNRYWEFAEACKRKAT